ncbi:Lrp/AsnC family transcriptional regulator [Sphingomonas sp.]|uniref:Lrp/AsnC family transcriptional regulator n=1 Tax=Sphingomonas sp. TaxID=28214 RepID=UPI001B26774B|nr:Lrp/AsnC family transcriptional regulator [Sphingomonas sp.]MBO9713753.1 Lrp/AsnC family transcriptional regulator [Sphingomonas sp.]
MADIALDSHDRRLLAALQADADATADQLAERVGLSASAVLRRIKRLKAAKVITATVAVVAPAKLGKPTFFIVALEVERDRPELLARLRSWMSDEPRIQEYFYVTGTTDFILVVVAKDVEDYDALMSSLVTDNPNVRKFTTNVVLSSGKRSLALPL